MKKTILTLITALFIPLAFGQELPPEELDLRPIMIPTVQKVKAGDTHVIPLPRMAYIDRLSLEADTSAFCKKSSFLLSFDGHETKRVEVDGGLRGYRTKIIRVDARTRTLEVFNSTGCKLKIRNIQILPRRWSEHHRQIPGHGPVYHPVSDAGAQVSFLLETFMYLEGLVGDADRAQFITPTKKAVGKALAILNTTPETSQASLLAIKDVLFQLQAARPFVERLATIEATFEASQEIQSVEAALIRMIR